MLGEEWWCEWEDAEADAALTGVRRWRDGPEHIVWYVRVW